MVVDFKGWAHFAFFHPLFFPAILFSYLFCSILCFEISLFYLPLIKINCRILSLQVHVTAILEYLVHGDCSTIEYVDQLYVTGLLEYLDLFFKSFPSLEPIFLIFHLLFSSILLFSFTNVYFQKFCGQNWHSLIDFCPVFTARLYLFCASVE